MKLLVIVILIGIVASLASGMVTMLKDPQGSRRTVRALTLRVSLSVLLFVILMVSFAMGWITPHGGPTAGPPPAQSQ